MWTGVHYNGIWHVSRLQITLAPTQQHIQQQVGGAACPNMSCAAAADDHFRAATHPAFDT